MREPTNDAKAGKLTKLHQEVNPDNRTPALNRSIQLLVLPGAVDIALSSK